MKKLVIFLTSGFLLYLLLGLLLFSCVKKSEVVKEPENDFLKIPEYTTETVTTSTYDDGNSYWFVLVEEKDGSLRMNSFIKQSHKYFSVSEAKAEFKKDVFILNIVKVDRETYEKNQ